MEPLGDVAEQLSSQPPQIKAKKTRARTHTQHINTEKDSHALFIAALWDSQRSVMSCYFLLTSVLISQSDIFYTYLSSLLSTQAPHGGPQTVVIISSENNSININLLICMRHSL